LALELAQTADFRPKSVNITGFTPAEFSMQGKKLEMLKEIAPQITRVAVLFNLEQIPQAGMLRAVEAVAPSVGVQLRAAAVRDAAEIEGAIDQFAREPRGGLVVLPSGATIVHRDLIIALAARYCLPAVYQYRQFVTAGGLMSYGNDLADQYRQAASYVDRILRGEKPGDLPVQQPTKFELIINLKTAKALGLEISPTLLARRRGDRVTRRSPRAGGSSQERGAAPPRALHGAHRVTTMIVHFRETPYGLAMSLVQTRRENGKVRHEHVASLGSIETPPSVAAPIEFWRELDERLAQLSNRLDAETRGKVMGAVHARVPMVTPDEKRDAERRSPAS
jgi:ABC transporter substrate binding protein